jgi:predicted nucleic acid-binding protein
MTAPFIDTNVLVYLIGGDDARADRAEAVLRARGTISVQVLNELAHAARRKAGLSLQEVHELLALVRGFVDVTPVTIATHELGLALCARYGFALFDSMLVAAAIEAGCETMWTDMQHGLVVLQTLRLSNPFREAPAASGES